MKTRHVFFAAFFGFGLVLITYWLLSLTSVIYAQDFTLRLEISPVMKNYDNGQQICTSIYTVTNEAVSPSYYAHVFYDSVQGGSVIHTVQDTIAAFSTRTYNLADSGSIPDGYRGRVVIYSDQPFTVTLASCPVTCSPDEWLGKYYDNRDLQGDPVLARCDSHIDFRWGLGRPDTSLPVDDFSVRWSKNIDISTSGWYHFRTFTDDGVRLFVDGEKIIDDWTARSFMEKSALKKLDPGSHQVTMEYVEWSNDAMAHLNWYHSLICPSAATDCQFNITPMYQTQYLDKPMPEGCSTEANQTIARWGCLVTSNAMVLRILGVNTDPDDLNHLLSKEEGAYRSQCNAELQGPVYVTRVISNTYGIRLNYVPVRTIDGAKSALRDGHPVIMRANNIQHFFLATDIAEFNGQEYIGFIDPHHAWSCQAVSAGVPPPVASQLQCSGSTLQHITTTQERFANSTPIYYLEPTTQLQTPILQLNTSGAEVLVTDNQNRRVGFDRATNEIVYEVPNSLYYDSEIVPPGGVSDGVIERTVFLPETPGGSYSLQVWGTAGIQAQTTSNFEINIVGFDRALEAIGTLITGTVTTGGIASYQIDFDPEQGSITVSGGNKYIYLPIIIK